MIWGSIISVGDIEISACPDCGCTSIETCRMADGGTPQAAGIIVFACGGRGEFSEGGQRSTWQSCKGGSVKVGDGHIIARPALKAENSGEENSRLLQEATSRVSKWELP